MATVTSKEISSRGAHIQETYDLIERDVCWHPNITNSPVFLEFVREVKDRFNTL